MKIKPLQKKNTKIFFKALNMQKQLKDFKQNNKKQKKYIKCINKKIQIKENF